MQVDEDVAAVNKVMMLTKHAYVLTSLLTFLQTKKK